MSPSSRLITRCPHCETMFRVTAEQLDAAAGKVRCSRCRKIFNARGHLQENAQSAATKAPRPSAPPQPVPPRSTRAAEPESAAGATVAWSDLEPPAEPPSPRAEAPGGLPVDDGFRHTPDAATEHPLAARRDASLDEDLDIDFDIGFDLDALADGAPLDESAIEDFTAEAERPPESRVIAPPETPGGGEVPAPDIDFGGEEDLSAGSLEIEAPAEDHGPPDFNAADDEITLSAEPWPTEPADVGAPPPVADDSGAPAPSAAATEPASDWLVADTVRHDAAADTLVDDLDDVDDLFSDWGRGIDEEPGTHPAPGAEALAVEPAPAPPGKEARTADEEEASGEATVAATVSASTAAAGAGKSTPYGSALVEELEATLTERGRRLPTLLFGAGSLLLFALLLVQAGSTFHARMARYPLLAPLATLFCAGQECATTQRRAPDQIRIINRDVRPHPSEPGALLISLSFVNEADFAQPYPVLEVSFSDIHDRLIALRRFQASEYLSGERRSSDLLPPGERAAVRLSVVDPGEQGISYRFEFY